MTDTSPPPNSDYLRKHQYRDSRNLSARIALHQRFSTNKYGWFRWVFDHLRLPDAADVLELGCGTGALWSTNAPRVPEGWRITLSDFSPGMLEDAARALAPLLRRFHCAAVEAQAIPFPDRSFDCVIANHMLYHVSSVEAALAQIHRVLKPGGRLLAATNGREHLREMWDLIAELERDAAGPGERALHERFGLENGPAQLSRWFAQVELHRYEDALVITEPEPLVAYAASVVPNPDSPPVATRLRDFRAFIHDYIRRHGCLSVTKDSGMFEAYR